MLRADIDIELRTAGPFLTQSSAPGGYGLDAVVARTADGLPCIHGSHIVGKLRQAWEELLDALGSARKNSDPVPKQDEIDDFLGQRLDKGKSAPRFKRLHFSDFVLADSSAHGAVRERIGIDAERGSVRPGAYFALETLLATEDTLVFRGRLSFPATNSEDAARVRACVECGLQWVPQLGADRSTGFGRLIDVTVGPVQERVVDLSANRYRENLASGFDLTLQPDGPFCIAERPQTGNLFVSREEIPGLVILGSLARTLNRLSGQRSAELAQKANDGDSFAELRKHFDHIRVTHAFPGQSCLQRPVRPPLSLVQAPGLCDVALLTGRCLIDGHVPAFSVDWKDDSGARKLFGWPQLRRELRVRTAIDAKSLRSLDEALFAYELVVPDGHCWHARVTLGVGDEIPQQDRPLVLSQLAALLELGLFGLGKTKTTARAVVQRLGTVRDAVESGPVAPGMGGDGLLVVTLQTPALLCSPAGLNETSGAGELRAAYVESWNDLCPQLELLRYFAQQTLSGGEYQHRRFRNGKPYRPWLLTEAGSVFVFRVLDRPEVENKVSRWLRDGLPVPGPVRTCYGISDKPGQAWRECPFIPQNGYGEIAVNLAVHASHAPGGRAKDIRVLTSCEEDAHG